MKLQKRTMLNDMDSSEIGYSKSSLSTKLKDKLNKFKESKSTIDKTLSTTSSKNKLYSHECPHLVPHPYWFSLSFTIRSGTQLKLGPVHGLCHDPARGMFRP